MQAPEETKMPKSKSESHCEENNPDPNKQDTAQSNEFTFNDMALKIGDKLHIKLSSAAGENNSRKTGEYFMANLIGYYPNRSLIVTDSNSSQITGSPFAEGDKLELFFFGGKTLFKFVAYVEKMISVPFRYLHLSFPNKITGQNIRNSKRINVRIEATVNSSNPEPVIISDISSTGAKIKANNKIGNPGDLTDLSIEKEVTLKIKANIRTFESGNSKNYPFSYGIEFTELQQDQTQALSDLIYHQVMNNVS